MKLTQAAARSRGLGFSQLSRRDLLLRTTEGRERFGLACQSHMLA